MRATIRKEFGRTKPRALVLDDNARARTMTARNLRKRGFEVLECKDVADFDRCWSPGTIDVIVADWNLSGNPMDDGDKVLSRVRKADWDVPFVLVSGKLDEDTQKAPVLARLLEEGSARFVKRGSSSIDKACEEAEKLIERRDLALLKLVLSLRPAALSDQIIQTSSGREAVSKLLAKIVSAPAASHDAERPIAVAGNK
ncbi:MAG TPA: response regulator [Polyangia bacterium]|nr:response regulator [Polyangia bacterium]